MTAARGALVLALAAAGCAAPVPKKVDFSEARQTYRADEYPKVLARWTRHRKVFSEEGTVIEYWAVFKSWDFRQAYVEAYANVYSLSDAERTALTAAQLEAERRAYEFHVAVQTTNFRWNDLEKESSAWHVSLVDGAGAEIDPTTVQVPKLPDIYESQFFPDKTAFSRTYLMKFNRDEAKQAGFAGPDSGRVTLRIASPVAKAEVSWESQ